MAPPESGVREVSLQLCGEASRGGVGTGRGPVGGRRHFGDQSQLGEAGNTDGGDVWTRVQGWPWAGQRTKSCIRRKPCRDEGLERQKVLGRPLEVPPLCPSRRCRRGGGKLSFPGRLIPGQHLLEGSLLQQPNEINPLILSTAQGHRDSPNPREGN